MTKIELIDEAFEKAERLESKLIPQAMDIGGYTSDRIRHLMNNLGSFTGNYLEIGCLKGALSVATLWGNDNDGTFIDNYSEFKEEGNREIFLQNMKRLEGREITIIEEDCFKIDPTHLPGYYDLYLYDADHSELAHHKAVTQFAPAMQHEFILCIDDWSWPQVEKGTRDGIAAYGFTIIKEWIRPQSEEWHNGYCVFLLTK